MMFSTLIRSESYIIGKFVLVLGVKPRVSRPVLQVNHRLLAYADEPPTRAVEIDN